MKKYKRFKQSYKSVINSVLDDLCYPRTDIGKKWRVAQAYGISEMYVWANTDRYTQFG